MSAKGVVITGATSGLGRSLAEILAPDPDLQLVVAARDSHAGDRVRADLSSVAAHPVLVTRLDLASLSSVAAFGQELDRVSAPALHALVCNAGVQDVSGMKRSADGLERTFAVNHLAHFDLTRRLLPRILEGGRILVVSSNTHDPRTKTGMPAPRYRDAIALAEGSEEEPDPVLAGRIRYTTSKLCNVYFARALARRLSSSDDRRLRSLRVAAFDPGMMPGTGLARDYNALVRFAWSYILPILRLTGSNVSSVSTSARRLAALVTDSAPAWSSGDYVSRGIVTAPSEEASSDARADDLWTSSEALLARLGFA